MFTPGLQEWLLLSRGLVHAVRIVASSVYPMAVFTVPPDPAAGCYVRVQFADSANSWVSLRMRPAL